MKNNQFAVILGMICLSACSSVGRIIVPPSKKPAFQPPANQQSGLYDIKVPVSRVFASAVQAIMEDYNIHVLSREDGIITTDWDHYFEQKKMQRNKISLLIKNNGWNRTELRIKNHTQSLNYLPSSGFLGQVWRPTKSSIKEEKRIVANIFALLYNQPLVEGARPYDEPQPENKDSFTNP